MNIENRIGQFEQEICSILARLAYFIDPIIVSKIQGRNRDDRDHFENIFNDLIDVDHYLFEDSACVFPGIRRSISAKGKKRKYNPEYKSIIDDNVFPRHIWAFLLEGKAYSGPMWKNTILSEFELAHIFTHKESELHKEHQFFDSFDYDVRPYSEFTCACNVVLLPKGTVRPTDNSISIKGAFFQRYVDLYGEKSISGNRQFKSTHVPSWYCDLKWGDPYLPDNWEAKVDKLLDYRFNRVTHLIQSYRKTLL